ncbi:hypothetical protein G3T36_02190 [Diaminobutyricibacter tongyongensis]|uniref:Uncharacterized protein n=1 Tax=Leifsonia tongyongensis TaxID=1268043 RepID=A0A6L9XTE2_9MICO|nr:hypothetical protein [Diaminobutyricibacter tongyongensis]NEN04670.1 hypothetical protein [Diaminobutyricibacter tongyongensis]
MSALMNGFEQLQRRRRRVAWLVVLACVAGVGTWLTGPIGAIMASTGNAAGWALLVAGVVLLAVTVFAIVAAVRLRVVPQSQPGAANPHFDEPQPSPDPRGGFSMNGSQIGGRI